MLEFKQKQGQYFAQAGLYKICWTGGKKPIYTASFKNEVLLYTKDKNKAKKACLDHDSR